MSIPAVIVLAQGGIETARKIANGLGSARLHGLAGRVEGAEVSFDDTGGHLRALFAARTPIIGVCAAGILVRLLAPVLGDKRAEPPVLAVAEDGSAVVPILGGHQGANRLAAEIAAALGVAPAITTAGDVRFGVALDDPPLGWTLANPDDAKAVMAKLLAGARVRLEGDAPWLARSGLPLADDGAVTLAVTHTMETGGADRLVYHPKVLALGVGCERGTDPAELADLVREAMAEFGLALGAVGVVASLDLKMDEAAVHALAEGLGVDARFFDAAALEAETPRLANPSDAVFAEVGCHGVAEGAALAAAGAKGRLLVAKRKSRRATCAVALAPSVIDADRVGRPQGTLFVIGTGPGAPEWLTPEVRDMVARTTDLVGYGLYLDLLGPLAEGKRRHDFHMGQEEARARHALELAAQGRTVALVSSGDPGIYAMATLVFELMERGGVDAWRRLAVRVAPGISALQGTAARVGAPVNHDFCTISLSDLLTPWETIERRVEAAARGDFVIAFYNPVSKKRRTQLVRAREILLEHRPAATPVVVARNVGREDEKITVTTLIDLDPETADMLTLVLVGSSETRALARGDGVNDGLWVYTPRGYAGKHRKGKGTP